MIKGLGVAAEQPFHSFEGNLPFFGVKRSELIHVMIESSSDLSFLYEVLSRPHLFSFI